MLKILVVRFSSIGDIVLTTPVVRCLKRQTDCELHYLTFEKYSNVLDNNPYIDKLITIRKSIKEVVPALRKERYDYIIDLHHNIRTVSLKARLRRPSRAFNKLNIRKMLCVLFKWNLLPDIHIVERYLKTVTHLGVKNDGEGLDYFLDDTSRKAIKKLPAGFSEGYSAIVIGGNYYTKMLPADRVASIIGNNKRPVVLLGGDADFEKGEQIVSMVSESNLVFNACGQFSLNESAALIENAEKVLTNDTGLMHISAALRKPLVSFWGNTIPGFGMYPYLPEGFQPEAEIYEVKGLKCRPCSKLGYKKCPKGHFKCMLDLPVDKILL